MCKLKKKNNLKFSPFRSWTRFGFRSSSTLLDSSLEWWLWFWPDLNPNHRKWARVQVQCVFGGTRPDCSPRLGLIMGALEIRHDIAFELEWVAPQTQRKESNSAGHVRIRNACDKGGQPLPLGIHLRPPYVLDTRLSKITWICISSRPAYPMFDDICIKLITLFLRDFSLAFCFHISTIPRRCR